MNDCSMPGVSVKKEDSEGKEVKEHKSFNHVAPFVVIRFGKGEHSENEETSD